ncbi:MAG: hypothetical protein IKG18_01440 [Atopobiaceae bacterium]|nr:hypothetical protein [Atopobiaceae bacterium]
MPKEIENARLPLDFGECEEDGREECTASAAHHKYTDEEITRAREIYREALAWIEDNPTAWAYMRKIFRELTERGRYFSFQNVVEQVRDKGAMTFTPRSGGRFSISHNHRSPLVRILRAEFPESRDLLRLKHTPFDEIV